MARLGAQRANDGAQIVERRKRAKELKMSGIKQMKKKNKKKKKKKLLLLLLLLGRIEKNKES